MPRCHNCGTDVSATSKFCSECGQDQSVSVPQDQRIQTEDVPVPPPPPPPEQGGGWKKWRRLIAAIVILIVFLAVFGRFETTTSSSQSDSKARAEERREEREQKREEQEQKKKEEEEQKRAAPAEEVAQEDPNPHFNDGTHQVGADIQPGTYRTREGKSGCYYERLAGFSGEFDEVLANSVTDGPAIITILPTDAGFKSQRCGTWTQDLSAITQSKTSFDAGAYIVGTDIEPGTYRSSGGSGGCYYERLSGFTGGFEEVIANEVTDTPTVVTIAPTDAGFQSHRCGTWTKIQ